MLQLIMIRQGDADTISETISGLESLSGYSAKMYIKHQDGTELDTLIGTIDGLVITYEIINESSKLYPIGKYYFETKIWDAIDHVYTPSFGRFIILTTLQNDPS